MTRQQAIKPFHMTSIPIIFDYYWLLLLFLSLSLYIIISVKLLFVLNTVPNSHEVPPLGPPALLGSHHGLGETTPYSTFMTW